MSHIREEQFSIEVILIKLVIIRCITCWNLIRIFSGDWKVHDTYKYKLLQPKSIGGDDIIHFM